MKLNRSSMIYANWLLAEQQRERVSNVPLRYKTTWRVRRIIELEPKDIDKYHRHYVTHDDDGRRITYACTEEVASGLHKREALKHLGMTLEKTRYGQV